MGKENYIEGTRIVELSSSGSWPWSETKEIKIPGSDNPTSNETVLTVHKEGWIAVQILGFDGDTQTMTSKTLDLSDRCSIKIAFSWEQGAGSLAVCGKIVASYPEKTMVSPAIGKKGSVSVDSHSEQLKILNRSYDLQSKRASLETGLRAPANQDNKSKKRIRSLEENLSTLDEYTQLLVEATSQVKLGVNRYLPVVTNTLVLLICKVAKADRPLLLRVAGLLDEPIWVYGRAQSPFQTIKGVEPTHGARTDIQADETDGLLKMDLEAWLESDACLFEGETLTNLGLLRLLRNKEGGHFDPFVSPEIAFLSSVGSDVDSFAKNYLIQTSEVVASVARELIGKAIQNG